MHLHLPLSLSDAMHLGRIVLFSCEHLGVRVVPEVLHTWVVDHGRLEQRREEKITRRSTFCQSVFGKLLRHPKFPGRATSEWNTNAPEYWYFVADTQK